MKIGCEKCSAVSKEIDTSVNPPDGWAEVKTVKKGGIVEVTFRCPEHKEN